MDPEPDDNNLDEAQPTGGDETGSTPVSKFAALRGIAKEVFAAEGGGEAFLKRQRDAFE